LAGDRGSRDPVIRFVKQPVKGQVVLATEEGVKGLAVLGIKATLVSSAGFPSLLSAYAMR
jgi:hypothetical protein